MRNLLFSLVVFGVAATSFPIAAFTGELSVARTYSTASGLPNNWIKGIFRDGSGWTHLDGFGPVHHSGELLYNDGRTLYAVARVMNGGVLSFDGKEWRIVDRGPGTGIMNNATCILSDGEIVYIGTTTNGLFRFDGRVWTVIGLAEELPGIWVASLALTGEGLWVGCNDGLALLGGGKIRTFSKGDGVPSRRIRCLKTVKGRLLVGTADAGLLIRTGERFETLSADKGLSDPRIQAIEEAPEGAWVGTVNGLNFVSIGD